MARPIKIIDEKLLFDLASIHCTMEEIAKIVNCSVDTLENRYSEVIKAGKAEGRASLRRMQFECAKTGNASMLIWLGKQLLGQKENYIDDSELKSKVFNGSKYKFIEPSE